MTGTLYIPAECCLTSRYLDRSMITMSRRTFTSGGSWSGGQPPAIDDDLRRPIVVIGRADVHIFHLRRPVGDDDLLDLIAEEVVETKGRPLILLAFFAYLNGRKRKFVNIRQMIRKKLKVKSGSSNKHNPVKSIKIGNKS